MTALFYPIALDLRGKRCLVVGGGLIADGKLDALLLSDAQVQVVSPVVGPRIADLAAQGRIALALREYRAGDLDGVYLAIAATDDRAVNAVIAAEARAREILVNAVDDPPNCDFYAVAIVRRGALQVSISTNGLSPAFARWMREQLDASLPQEYTGLLSALGDVRDELRAAGPIPEYEHWQAAITPEVLEQLRLGRDEAARELLRAPLSAAAGR
jgi:precorrin-2 dehydrogenase/sirohydrochlorin ferrochelatase